MIQLIQLIQLIQHPKGNFISSNVCRKKNFGNFQDADGNFHQLSLLINTLVASRHAPRNPDLNPDHIIQGHAQLVFSPTLATHDPTRDPAVALVG